MSDLPKPVYVMSEPHLSGYRVIIGYETLSEAQDAQAALCQPPAREDAQPVRCHHEAYQGYCAHCGVKVVNGFAMTPKPHPAPDALRVVVEALEAAQDALPVRSERSRNVEVRGKIDKALAALQAEQGAK